MLEEVIQDHRELNRPSGRYKKELCYNIVMDAVTDLGKELRTIERRKRKEQEFVDKQAEELQAAGVTNIINSYGTDDIDDIDRLWWRVLNKMVDQYLIK